MKIGDEQASFFESVPKNMSGEEKGGILMGSTCVDQKRREKDINAKTDEKNKLKGK